MRCPTRPVHRHARRAAGALLARAALLLAAAGAPLPAQPAGPPPRTIPFTVTTSGGVSLGSYQAGVNWALVELLKRTRDSLPARILRGHYELRAVTGASAGNINGVLTAVAWCRQPRPAPPESSLFWRMWVNTGWAQLFPDDSAKIDTSEMALFDRGAHFAGTLFPALRAELDAADVPECEVPVGVTVTRLVPERVTVAGNITAATQRFAVPFVARTDAGGAPGMTFVSPSFDVRGNRRIGAMLLLPRGRDGTIEPDTILEVIQASSAFPGFFAPRRLSYYLNDPERKEDDCERSSADGECYEPSRAFFGDGGVFDNTPLSLAQQLGSDSNAREDSLARDTLRRMIFVDAGYLRARYAELQRERDVDRTAAGLNAVKLLLDGAVPAARQYELQVLSRTLNSAQRAKGYLTTTTRGWPIVGEHLGAFAAFLGRPFRAFDFYVGVYDGLHYVSTVLVCDDSAPADSAPADRARASDPDCVPRTLRRLIDPAYMERELGVRLGPVAPAVLGALFAREFERDAVPRLPVAANGHDGATIRMMRTFVDAADSLLYGERRSACAGMHILQRALCDNGFRDFLRIVAADTQTLRFARDSAAACGRRQPGYRYDCDADALFVRMLEGPERLVDSLVRTSLDRMYRVEDSLHDSGRPTHERVLEVLMFAYHSSVEHYRRGWELDPSTIPDSDRRKRRAMQLLPYHAAMSVGVGNIGIGGGVLGWRPSYYLGGGEIGRTGLAVIAPIEVFWTHDRSPGAGAAHWRYTAGLGVALQRKMGLLYGVEASAHTYGDITTPGTRGRLGTDDVGAELAARLGAGGKVRVGVRRVPDSWRSTNGGRTFAPTVGIADLNGTLYWLYRIL